MPFPNRKTQFKPGQSGNPGGRPKKGSVTIALREQLENKKLQDVKLKGRTVSEAVAAVILTKAVEGDFRFVELVMDRIDGKVSNTSEVNTSDCSEQVRAYLDLPQGKNALARRSVRNSRR